MVRGRKGGQKGEKREAQEVDRAGERGGGQRAEN